MNDTSLLGIFFTGLIAGGLACMAVQGGLLASAIVSSSAKARVDHQDTIFPLLSFLAAKLIAYTIFGLLLGILGSAFQLSLLAKTILQFAVVIFMLGTALNILEVHPLFRYFVVQPPKFLTRLVRKESKSKNIFAPALLGMFTVFIPCGTTQAMMALAIASGKPLYGAAILFAFILGTSPVFFLLGYGATRLGDVMQHNFMKFAALAIIVLAVFNANNAVALTGSNLTLENIGNTFYCTFFIGDSCSEAVGTAIVENANIAITEQGYNPNTLTIKAGSQIHFHLKNTSGVGCTQAFTIPSLGLQKVVPQGMSGDLAFTAPNKSEDIQFMCSMGMYRGVLHVRRA